MRLFGWFRKKPGRHALSEPPKQPPPAPIRVVDFEPPPVVHEAVVDPEVETAAAPVAETIPEPLRLPEATDVVPDPAPEPDRAPIAAEQPVQTAPTPAQSAAVVASAAPADLTPRTVDPVGVVSGVHLGFADGTRVDLDEESQHSQALRAIAMSLVSTDEPARRTG